MWDGPKCGTGSQPVRGREAAALRAADGLRTRPTYSLSSLHHQPVRPRSGGEGGVEVELEPRIERQAVARHLGHVNLVVAFRVNLSGVVLVEEVVGDDQALFVVGQAQVMRAGAGAQIEN